MERRITYGLSLLVGLAAVLWILPLPVLWGGGPGWLSPGPDQAQSLTGHLAFQADGWRWPLLQVDRLFWPHGISLALVDSNALVSLAAKVWTRVTGAGPENWLGAFIGLCWLLQPVAAAYAARGLGARAVGAVAAGVIAVAWPALMFRMMHLNLCAHFLVLVALGMAFRGVRAAPGRGWWVACWGLLAVAVLVHPYLFQLCAAVLAAVPLQAALRREGGRRAGWRREALLYLGAGVFAVALLRVLGGPIGGGDKGFVFFSMNLVSPFWPQRSGVFGAGLPIVDATGGQYEGLNWLGAGCWLLLLAGLAGAVVRRAVPRPALVLVLVLAGLAALSLSSVVYAGPIRVVNLGTKPWEDVFGSFRSAGRAFWPVGYALMLGGVALVERLPRRLGWAVFAAAVGLQVVDIGPLQRDARAAWANGSGIEVPSVPAGSTLFTVAPHPGCAKEMPTKWGAPEMLLDAVRQGARTGDIGLGRSPPWFACERVVADALELPLLKGESRAFFGPLAAEVRPERLGGACWRTVGVRVGAQAGPVVLCAEVAGPGELVAAGAAPLPLALPANLAGEGLRGVLGFGWAMAGGVAWSEGPRSTLLIPVSPGVAGTVVLRAAGVGGTAGEARRVTVMAGREDVGAVSLPDGAQTEVSLGYPASATASGMLRLAFDMTRPVDPSRRGLAAPVQRAAIVLHALTVTGRGAAATR